MALIGGIRHNIKALVSSGAAIPKTCTVSRGLHAAGVETMGGHSHHSEPVYVHAKHMYNLDRMKHQELKMSLSVLATFSIGVAVPVYAVRFQQKKTAFG